MGKNQLSSGAYCMIIVPAIVAGVLSGFLAASISAPDSGPMEAAIEELRLDIAHLKSDTEMEELRLDVARLKSDTEEIKNLTKATDTQGREIQSTIALLEKEFNKLKVRRQETVRTKTKAQFTYLRQFKPSNIQNGFGADILLKDDLSEQELVSFVKHLAGSHNPVLIRIFTSRVAYDQEQNNNYGPEYDSNYILFYVKNFSSAPAYRGFNEIRWMQKIGKFSSKFGTKTKF